MLADFELPIQECTNLSEAGRGRRHVEEEEEEASKEGAFRTHFTTDIIRPREREREKEGGRAIQTAINKHVEGDTISWPQEQLPLSPSPSFLPSARQGCQLPPRKYSLEQTISLVDISATWQHHNCPYCLFSRA